MEQSVSHNPGAEQSIVPQTSPNPDNRPESVPVGSVAMEEKTFTQSLDSLSDRVGKSIARSRARRPASAFSEEVRQARKDEDNIIAAGAQERKALETQLDVADEVRSAEANNNNSVETSAERMDRLVEDTKLRNETVKGILGLREMPSDETLAAAPSQVELDPANPLDESSELVELSPATPAVEPAALETPEVALDPANLSHAEMVALQNKSADGNDGSEVVEDTSSQVQGESVTEDNTAESSSDEKPATPENSFQQTSVDTSEPVNADSLLVRNGEEEETPPPHKVHSYDYISVDTSPQGDATSLMLRNEKPPEKENPFLMKNVDAMPSGASTSSLITGEKNMAENPYLKAHMEDRDSEPTVKPTPSSVAQSPVRSFFRRMFGI